MHPGNAAEQLRNALNRAGHSCGRGLGREADTAGGPVLCLPAACRLRP